jgi:predicted nuclease of predicted toxin-antitoxin system
MEPPWQQIMNCQEAVRIVENAIAKKEGRSLNNVELAIFQGSWERLSYKEIGERFGYEENYIKGDAGHKFWKLLSKALGDQITKTNFKAVLESMESHDIATVSRIGIYIERPPLESICEREILKPGALLRIKGSPKMGKTWLLTRLINFAESQGYQAVHLPLKLAEKRDYQDIDSFLRWLCISVSQLLTPEYQPEEKDWWENQLGNSKLKAMGYIEQYWLSKDRPSFVLGLDDLDEVFPYSEIADEFLSLLRSLHEKARTREEWGKFGLILSYQESYEHLPAHMSPFNVGLEVQLSEFNGEQIQDLVTQNGLDRILNQQDIQELLRMLGGHPHLLQLTLDHLTGQNVTLQEIFQQSCTNLEIYTESLQKQLSYLQADLQLKSTFQKILISDEPVDNLELKEKYKLEELGLVKCKNSLVVPFCQLYREYFKSTL